MKTIKFTSVIIAMVLFFIFYLQTETKADTYSISETLTGLEEVPPNGSAAYSLLIGNYDDVTNTLNFSVSWQNFTAGLTAGHFHGPALPGVNASVQIGFTGIAVGSASGTYSNTFILSAAQETQLLSGLWYVNLHSTTFPGGEVRSQLNPVISSGNIFNINETLSGLEEVPPNASPATGTLVGTYDDNTNTLIFTVSWQNFTGGTTAGHFHGPAIPGVNASVQIGFTGFPTAVMSGSYGNTFVLTGVQETQLLAGLWYVNIHSSIFPGGEIRSQLNPVIPGGNIFNINETLSGLEEVPPNASPATGTLVGTYYDNTNTLLFTVTWQNFIGVTTVAHFHGPALPGVNASVRIGFTGFPTGLTSGSYGNAFVLTAAQETQLLAGLWYVNLHSSQFPGGEIRSQLNPEMVLPVELTSFISVISGNDVTLNWSTSSEINNSGFDIERSSSPAVWEKVGFVNGNGNSGEVQTYTYSDKGLTAGVYNYRLKQIDFNGNFEYFNLSNEVIISVPNTFELSQNYPNPFNPETKIDYSVPVNENVMLNLYDMSGKLVKTLVNDFKSAGYYSYRLNASDLSSGIYIYKLVSGSVSISKKLMLVK